MDAGLLYVQAAHRLSLHPQLSYRLSQRSVIVSRMKEFRLALGQRSLLRRPQNPVPQPVQNNPIVVAGSSEV